GLDDVAIADGGDVVVFLGTKDVVAIAPVSRNAFSAPRFISLVDVNGDNRLDLVVADGTGLAFAPGHGDGTFAPEQLMPNGKGRTANWIATGDFNGDSAIDLASVEPPSIAVSLGDGKGGLAPPAIETPSMTLDPETDAVADFDGDGSLDVAVAGFLSFVYIYRGDGK